jgi:F-type H+-transporting ATPase subunit epsilon
MQFDLVTPSAQIASMEADYVMVPGEEGMFGVLDGHAPLISSLKAGVLSVKQGEEETVYCVGSGLADVQPTGVTILADEITKKEDINTAETEKSLEAVKAEIATYADDESKVAILEKAQKKQAYFEAMLEMASA